MLEVLDTRSAPSAPRSRGNDAKWGRWFQRAVRLPTERLEVDLAFPAALDPVVWGTETSPPDPPAQRGAGG
ncbi:hypothetical protein [Streptomyces sp. NPDC002132]|uniref:hypothetical protein n=1 Tax=unclassified Streptomyces TaxID=2593676 RepID=UPI00332BBCB4